MQNVSKSFVIEGICDIRLIESDKEAADKWTLFEIRYDDAKSTIKEFKRRDKAYSAFYSMVREEIDFQEE